MGIFESLLRTGMRAASNVVVNAMSEAISDTLKGDSKQSVTLDSALDTTQSTVKQSVEEYGDRSFDEKLQEILQNMTEYEIRRNISPDELEREAGREIYPRGGSYAKPDELTYVFYKNGQRVLVINLWGSYQSYKHVANREIRRYCISNGIKVLDFFDYMPNEADYMKERICAQL